MFTGHICASGIRANRFICRSFWLLSFASFQIEDLWLLNHWRTSSTSQIDVHSYVLKPKYTILNRSKQNSFSFSRKTFRGYETNHKVSHLPYLQIYDSHAAQIDEDP